MLVKNSWAVIVVAMIAIGLPFILLKVADDRAFELVNTPPIRSDINQFADLCRDAGQGLQSSLMMNRIADGTLKYWTPSIDIRDLPKKMNNEFRVVLIGGLGQQLGPSPNSTQFSLPEFIEQHTNELLGGVERKVKVLNFSAYAANTYQNYLLLNLSGYFSSNPLSPDLIVAYSGFNDWVIPYFFEGLPEVYCGFTRNQASSVYSNRSWETPPSLRWLDWLFPSIMRRTAFGSTLKQLWDRSYYEDAGREGYKRHRNLEWTDTQDMFNRLAVPFFIDSLKSIKRDQEGVPIMVAWQAIEEEEFKNYGNPKSVLGENFYEEMFARTRKELSGYVNRNWQFVDIHGEFKSDPRSIGISPSVDAQKLIAARIANEIVEIVNPK